MTPRTRELGTPPRRALVGKAELPPATAYGRGLERASGGRAGYRVRGDDGSVVAIPLDRWIGPATPVDERVLAHSMGPVLDVGCGPGRHLHALRRARVAAVGVDVSAVAVRLARAGGAEVRHGSVFDSDLGEGTWATVLLLDGNIGIGGAPLRLLARVRELLRPGGAALVELDAPGFGSRATRLRLEGPGVSSGWFRWTRTGVDEISALARRAGFRLESRWEHDGRWFARLERPARRRGR